MLKKNQREIFNCTAFIADDASYRLRRFIYLFFLLFACHV